MRNSMVAACLVLLPLGAFAGNAIAQTDPFSGLGTCKVEIYHTGADRRITIQERDAAFEQIENSPYAPCPAAIRYALNSFEDVFSKQGYVTVEAVNAAIIQPFGECVREQRIYLRGSILDINALACDGETAAASPASFAFSYDDIAGVSEVAVDGALAVALVEPGLVIGRDTDFTLLAFVEAEGQFVTDTENTGFTRAGLISQMKFYGGGIDSHLINIAGYWQSDIDLTASAYGASVSWQPQYLAWHLGGYVAPPEQQFYYYWLFDTKFDLFHVDDPANTSLIAGTNYAWLGANLGFRSAYKPDFLPNGVEFSADAGLFSDLASGRDAYLFKTRVDFNLNEAGTASVGIGYTYGKPKETLQKQSIVLAGFNVRF